MPKKIERTPEKEALLRRLRKDGVANEKIATALGIKLHLLYTWMNKLGLPKREKNNGMYSRGWCRRGKPAKPTPYESTPAPKIEVTDEEVRELTIRAICRSADYGTVTEIRRTEKKILDRKTLCHYCDERGNKCNEPRVESSSFCAQHEGHRVTATGYRSCADLRGTPVS